MITVSNRQRKVLIKKASAERLIEAVLSHLKAPFSEVAIYFVSKKAISDLHKEFMDDPTPTDCITFPYETNPLEGEGFACPEVALEYAHEHGKDLYEELSLYVVHCLLHMLGYDDIDPQKRKQMRQKERTCMTFLKKNKYLIS